MFVEIVGNAIAAFIIALPLLLLGSFLFLLFGRPFLALKNSPPSDITLIRARLDGEAHHIVSISRNGEDWEITRGGAKTWRKYDMVVRYPDGSEVSRTVGVSTSLIFTRYLVTYAGGRRQPLWTHHQASVP